MLELLFFCVTNLVVVLTVAVVVVAVALCCLGLTFILFFVIILASIPFPVSRRGIPSNESFLRKMRTDHRVPAFKTIFR